MVRSCPGDPDYAFSAISLADLQEEIVRQRLHIHPAMAPHFQPQADGCGSWSAGGVSWALANLRIPAQEFCESFGIGGLKEWLGTDLRQHVLDAGLQKRVSDWLMARGWRPMWTWAAICRVGTSLGITEETMVLAFGLEWVDAWRSAVPTEEWDAVEAYFCAAGWRRPPRPE